jgi:hypothetical protein
MKKISLIAVLVCFAVLGMAQQKGKAIITFSEKSYDFGTVKEEVGKVTHEFEFVNSGDAPLVIQNVQASCGCTTPVWTKEPIAPGAKGKIVVTYSAAGRPGPFNKQITVSSNAVENPVILIIKGQVEPKPVSQVEAYPLILGAVRAKSHYVAFGNVVIGQSRTSNFAIWNNSKTPATVSFEKLPKHLKATMIPNEIQPGQEATIQFTLLSDQVKDWGIHNDEIVVVVNNDKAASKNNKLIVSSNLLEDFSKVTPEQRKNAPVPVFPVKEIKMGKIKVDSKTSGSFEVKNNGASQLIIHKASVDCNCITFNFPQKGIAPGKSAMIRFVIAPDKTPGVKFQTVNILTNSPDLSLVQLKINWETVSK